MSPLKSWGHYKEQIDPETIRHETIQYRHRAHAMSEQVFGRFIDLFNLPPKRAALRSR